MSQPILEEIIPLMHDLFDEYDGPITRETTARDIPQWDSLAHVQLIVMIEQELGVRFTTTEIQGFTSLGDVIDLVSRKRAA